LSVDLGEIGDEGSGGLEIRKPTRPSTATRAKSLRLAESRAEARSAPECRWHRPPRVGESV